VFTGLALLVLLLVPRAAGAEAPRAARSVHFGWLAPDGELFYNELVVEQSTPGSYFMACGWDTGYFGIQELDRPDQKVALFSVWDPTSGDNPNAVAPEQRVEVLHQDPDVRIKRFGGEGTGGQCMMDLAWRIGETNRFLVRAVVEGPKTSYSGYLFLPSTGQWKHLVTFRTRTGGRPLSGYYSFIEDFRRDGKSANETRRARLGNGWVRSVASDWVALTRGRFTASSAEWESKDNIDAGLAGVWFVLATGGDTRCTRPLRSILSRTPVLSDLPMFPGTGRND
jgi:hypothetical protein